MDPSLSGDQQNLVLFLFAENDQHISKMGKAFYRVFLLPPGKTTRITNEKVG